MIPTGESRFRRSIRNVRSRVVDSFHRLNEPHTYRLPIDLQPQSYLIPNRILADLRGRYFWTTDTTEIENRLRENLPQYLINYNNEQTRLREIEENNRRIEENNRRVLEEHNALHGIQEGIDDIPLIFHDNH